MSPVDEGRVRQLAFREAAPVVHGAREVASGGAHHAIGERLKVSMINLLLSLSPPLLPFILDP
jgi:hypothetical protein